MKALLQDDGALLGSRPGPTSAGLLFLSYPHTRPHPNSPQQYWFSCQPISGSVSRSADVFFGAAMMDSRRDLQCE